MKAQPFTVALGVFFTTALFAQRALGPEDAVAIALERNANLTAGSARVVAAEGLRVQAGLRPNPRLILQSENTRFAGSPSFLYQRDTDNFGYISQILEAAAKRQSRIDLASENVKAGQLSLGAQRTQLASRVLAAYWTAVGAKRLMNVLFENLGVMERTVQYHEHRVREGSLPEADLIRVQLEYQQVSLNYQNAEQDARRSILQLFREMGIPEEPGAELTGDIAAVTPIPAADADEAVERRPDVKLAIQSVQQSRAALGLQKANAKPDPEVLFGYKRTAGFNTVLAGVQFNLPIRNRNEGAIAAAAADETSAAATLRAVRTAARTEIQTLRSEYEQKRELVEEMLPAMRAGAAETSRIADAVYREGASDLLRLLDAQRVRIQMETLYIRTVLDYRQAAVNLQIALGLLP
jgi:cobalt-zinc-cadmium efflux system outer membrane protein